MDVEESKCNSCRNRFKCWTEVINTVRFEGQEYYAIKELDLQIGIISFVATSMGGSFFTKLPISSVEYRKKSSTNYNLYWRQGEGCTCIFFVTDDYGRQITIEVKETEKNRPFVLKNKQYVEYSEVR